MTFADQDAAAAPALVDDPAAPEYFADGLVAVPGETVVSLVFYRDPPLAGRESRREILTVVIPRSRIERLLLTDIVRWPAGRDPAAAPKSH